MSSLSPSFLISDLLDKCSRKPIQGNLFCPLYPILLTLGRYTSTQSITSNQSSKASYSVVIIYGWLLNYVTGLV